MSYEEIKSLPQDTQIIVQISYKYSPDDITEEMYSFWMRNNADIIQSNTKQTDEQA